MIRSLFFLALSFSAFARNSPLEMGTMTSVSRDPRYVVVAPHGGYDLETEKIVETIATSMNWSSVIADGYRRTDHPINVNRPTEGVKLLPDQEQFTERAQVVYQEFARQVLEVSKQQMQFYVEIHGMNNPGAYYELQIATVGISYHQATRLKKMFEQGLRKLSLDQSFKISMEQIDPLFYEAPAAKRWGVLKTVPMALHIELPRALRVENRELGEQLLMSVLPQVPSLLDCSRRLTVDNSPSL